MNNVKVHQFRPHQRYSLLQLSQGCYNYSKVSETSSELYILWQYAIKIFFIFLSDFLKIILKDSPIYINFIVFKCITR